MILALLEKYLCHLCLYIILGIRASRKTRINRNLKIPFSTIYSIRWYRLVTSYIPSENNPFYEIMRSLNVSFNKLEYMIDLPFPWNNTFSIYVVFATLSAMCLLNVNLLSRWKPRYLTLDLTSISSHFRH